MFDCSVIKLFRVGCVPRVPLTHLRRSTSRAGIKINSGRRHVVGRPRPDPRGNLFTRLALDYSACSAESVTAVTFELPENE